VTAVVPELTPAAAAADPVAAARDLAPLAAASADAIERAGRLPDELVAGLTEARLFDLFLPADVGGLEADPLTALLAVEALARADASTGWCVQVSVANAWQLAALEPDAVRSMVTEAGRALRVAGSARPLGRATRVEGGYRVSGRWDFASNVLHADWYVGTCISEEDGRRRSRVVAVPVASGEIIETWDVAGLRGSGSHDFAVHDVFVPDCHVAAGRNLAARSGPLYRPRLTMVANWSPTAGIGLGVAQGAIDAFVAMADQGTANTVDVALRDRADCQRAVGRAAAKLGAARAYCLDAIGRAWQADDGTDPATFDEAVRSARLAITHALHTAVEVVDLLFHAGGTRSVYAVQGLERRWRDAHVAMQHGAALPTHFDAAGRLVMGLPANAPAW